MDPTLLFILSMTELVTKYGLPAALDIMHTWQHGEEPTIEEIQELRNRVPNPESYFEKNEPPE